ncbi:MAG: putative RecB family exonuclease [Frankiaceae bacterium]|nr:putative RecB family exonuclease [Frankiaceae bacterium]
MTQTPDVETATTVDGPADAAGTRTGLLSLSPSRALDFMTCPLRYRFRVIDRLVEPPTAATAKGTLVHAVLERLFDVPPAERTIDTATRLATVEWDRLVEEKPELLTAAGEAVADGSWSSGVEELLATYFRLEDPRRLTPAAREVRVEAELDGGLRLMGYIDRLDQAPTGELRIVDYKTGRAPQEAFEGKALFQLKFYALVLWRTRGVVPKELRLIYLGEGELLRYTPHEAELIGFERTVRALWAAIERAMLSGDWRPRPSKLCGWCSHQALCPAFGGETPPLPVPAQVLPADPAVPSDPTVLANAGDLPAG